MSKKTAKKSTKSSDEKTKTRRPRKSFKEAYTAERETIWNKKRARVKLHRSFKRSYREDYNRPLETPGLVAHATSTLKIIFKNWRIFVPLIIVIVAANIILVGLMSEDTYVAVQDSIEESNEALQYGELGRVAKSGLLLISTVTTGGLTKGMTEVQQVFAILLFAITWLCTIYYLRHLLAGNHPKMRDGLFNALTPLISSICIIAVVFIHAIPILVFMVLYSTALSTEFLAQPLYAFLFWLVGSLLLLLSAYLLPTSLLALVAVSVPGIYPIRALYAATDLVQGRRTKFIIRLLFGLLFLAVIWVIIMMPIIWLDLVIKQNVEILAGFPFVSLCLQIMTMFSFVYITAYIYLYYRRMLDGTE